MIILLKKLFNVFKDDDDEEDEEDFDPDELEEDEDVCPIADDLSDDDDDEDGVDDGMYKFQPPSFDPIVIFVLKTGSIKNL